MPAGHHRTPRVPWRGAGRAALVASATALAACAPNVPALVARGDLHGACHAVRDGAHEHDAAVARAVRESLDVDVTLEVLGSDAIRATLGLVPAMLEREAFLVRERYAVVAAPGKVHVTLASIDGSAASFDARYLVPDDDLVALFAPPPKPGEAPDPSNVGAGFGGLLLSGAVRVLSGGQHSVGELDRALDRSAESAWQARRARDLAAWRAKVDADPEKRAARDKARALFAPSSFLPYLAPGDHADRYVLLVPRGAGEGHGVTLDLSTDLRDPERGPCMMTERLSVPLPARGGDLRAEVAAVFGPAPRKLAALPTAR